MCRRKILKLVHLLDTVLLAFSACYILILALRQVGKSWWFIVSLSGYSAPIAFLLISLYLFAIYRGVARSQRLKIEHPLTTSVYYVFFYNISPPLGVLAGGLGAIGTTKIAQYLLMTATGCLFVTFIVWIIVDPIAGIVEILLPSSQKHRRLRLAQSKAMRQKQQLANQALLAEVEAQQQMEQNYWNKALKPYAGKLATLMTHNETPDANMEAEAVDLGVSAWQIGGLGCMRQLHFMAAEICRRNYHKPITIDLISIYWDGIGSWRSHWLEGES